LLSTSRHWVAELQEAAVTCTVEPLGNEAHPEAGPVGAAVPTMFPNMSPLTQNEEVGQETP
jgi:hypothetical protein